MPAIFGRFVALVFGAIGATIIISLWTADGFGEPPLFFKIVGSLIASLFVFIGVSGGILLALGLRFEDKELVFPSNRPSYLDPHRDRPATH